MKPFSIFLIVVVVVMGYFHPEAIAQRGSAPIAPHQSTDANQDNLPGAVIERHEAGDLTTEPATINSEWNNVTSQSQNLKDNSISLEQKKGCESITPLDLLNNPDALLRECVNPTDNRTPQRVEPVEYLKVPGLDSGIKVNITNF